MRQGVTVAVIAAILLAVFSSWAQETKPGVPTACPVVAALATEGGAHSPEATSGCVMLFNGKDLTGLMGYVADSKVDPATVWSVKDGVIRCTGSTFGYLRTTEKYSNYRLCFQWRWAGGMGGNSGCFLHIQEKDEVWPKSIESELKSDNAGDFWVNGGVDFKERTNKGERHVLKQQAPNEKPVGEWNQMIILCDDDAVQVAVNGVLQNSATELTVKKGYIGLQSERAPVEFRCICLTPLEKLSSEQRKNWMTCPLQTATQGQAVKETK